MSEPPSAASLFRAIQAHSLTELLSSVLHETSPLGYTLIPSLDEHLSQTRRTSACKRGDVIELQGPAASGKSHMLYYLLMNCVLPPSIGSIKLGGWGKAAVLLDTDKKFDVRRFDRLLRSRIKRLLSLDSPDVEALITKALDHFHVFQPKSSHQLATTIQHLPMYLATNLPDADLGILAVDSITAFYWSDRYILEQAHSGDPSSILGLSKTPLNHVFASLQSLARSHGPLILLSSWDLSPPSTTQVRRRFDLPPVASNVGKDILPASHHITLTASSITSGDCEAVDSEHVRILPTTCLFGTVRTFGNFSQTTKFVLHITEDDVFVP